MPVYYDRAQSGNRTLLDAVQDYLADGFRRELERIQGTAEPVAAEDRTDP